MKLYTMTANERAMSGFSHLFIVQTADLTGFSNVQVTLLALNIGDVVFPKILIENKTATTGPTGSPTASLGVTGAATQFTATFVATTATYVVPPGSTAEYATTASSKSIILDLQAGGGNGAAATAGEIWVWANLSLVADRTVKG